MRYPWLFQEDTQFCFEQEPKRSRTFLREKERKRDKKIISFRDVTYIQNFLRSDQGLIWIFK